MQILSKLDGKKTYIVAVTVLVLGFLAGFNIYEVPEFVWPILGAFGLGFMRIAVTGIKNTIDGVKKELKK